MKFKKFSAAALAVLMLVSCMSFTVSAENAPAKFGGALVRSGKASEASVSLAEDEAVLAAEEWYDADELKDMFEADEVVFVSPAASTESDLGEGTAESPYLGIAAALAEFSATDTKVVYAFTEDWNVTANVTILGVVGDVVFTSASKAENKTIKYGAANLYIRFEVGADVELLLENLDIETAASGENFLCSRDWNITFGENVTVSETAALTLLLGYNAENLTTKNVITLKSGTVTTLSATRNNGATINGDIKYVVGGTATVNDIYMAGMSGTAGVQRKVTGDVTLNVEGTASVTTAMVNRVAYLNGNAYINVTGGTLTNLAASAYRNSGGTDYGVIYGNIVIGYHGGTIENIYAYSNNNGFVKNSAANRILVANIENENLTTTKLTAFKNATSISASGASEPLLTQVVTYNGNSGKAEVLYIEDENNPVQYEITLAAPEAATSAAFKQDDMHSKTKAQLVLTSETETVANVNGKVVELTGGKATIDLPSGDVEVIFGKGEVEDDGLAEKYEGCEIVYVRPAALGTVNGDPTAQPYYAGKSWEPYLGIQAAVEAYASAGKTVVFVLTDDWTIDSEVRLNATQTKNGSFVFTSVDAEDNKKKISVTTATRMLIPGTLKFENLEFALSANFDVFSRGYGITFGEGINKTGGGTLNAYGSYNGDTFGAGDISYTANSGEFGYLSVTNGNGATLNQNITYNVTGGTFTQVAMAGIVTEKPLNRKVTGDVTLNVGGGTLETIAVSIAAYLNGNAYINVTGGNVARLQANSFTNSAGTTYGLIYGNIVIGYHGGTISEIVPTLNDYTMSNSAKNRILVANTDNENLDDEALEKFKSQKSTSADGTNTEEKLLTQVITYNGNKGKAEVKYIADAQYVAPEGVTLSTSSGDGFFAASEFHNKTKAQLVLTTTESVVTVNGEEVTLTDGTATIDLPAGDVVVLFGEEEEPEVYTVTWTNYNGEVLETDENVTAGTMPEYNGNEPTKAGNAQYSYTFNGWTPEVSAVAGNVTYTAAYTETLNKYTVKWIVDGNETPEEYSYGAIIQAPEDPEKDADDEHTYTFSHWAYENEEEVEFPVTVEGDITLIAVWDSEPIVEEATVLTVTISIPDKAGHTYENIGRLSYREAGTDADFEEVEFDEIVADEIRNDDEAAIQTEFTVKLEDVEEGKTYEIVIEKNGYIAYTEEITISKGANSITVELIGGDIKGDENDFSGNGNVGFDDFVRIVRGFSDDDSEGYKAYSAFVDIDENGVVNVRDLAIVKDNYGVSSYEETDTEE